MECTSIRNKSHYSCGLSVGTSKQYIESAKEKGLTSIAITDSCTLGGALDFYNQGKKLDFKVAIGVEFKIDYGEAVDTLPIALICYNQIGYTNLCRLTTLANANNKILNLQEIYDFNDGLYCITPELKHKKHLVPIFNDKLFFELVPYMVHWPYNLDIIKNIPESQIVVSSDSYMPNQDEKILQDIMYQNSTFGKKENLFDHAKYMMGIQDLLQNFVTGHKTIPQKFLIAGIKNAAKIVDECSQLKLKFNDQIVNYPHRLHPLNPDGCDKNTLLRRIIYDNARWDFEDTKYKERLEYEIDAITNNSRVNLIDYFLVLEDLCRYCKNNDIPVGPGRGSGAGSLVLYGLGVTHLDPIHYGLLFERFISKGRIEAGTLPDVDLDFADQDVVRKYLTDLYGEDRVMPIGTYQKLATRGAMKDAFKILYPEIDFQIVNSITATIDDDLRQEGDSEVDFFHKQFTDNPAFNKQMEPYPEIRNATAKLVGFNRQPGIHPCGLAITQDPIKDFMPIRITKDREILEYQADDCEASGIIKFDILGLKTLKYFQTCLRNIDREYQKDIHNGFNYPKTIYDIPLEDQRTYDAFSLGDTESVFQFNSNVAKAILTNIKIESLDDLSMVTSVGRPGPMKNNQHNDFIKRKNGDRPPTPPHKALKELLEETFGVMIYQESVMKTAQLMGGYSLAETDNIRKAMGKKKIEILLKYKEGFLKYCQEKFPDTKNIHYDDKGEKDDVTIAEYIWNLMETFSGYGFNKSHSMSYTLIGYYCQYLKVHYPLEWWAGCLTHADKDQTKRFYSAYKKRILLPAVLHSTDKYEIIYEKDCVTDENGDDVEGWIVMPFESIKAVGGVAAKSIQNNTPYKDFEDFFNTAKSDKGRRVNKSVVCNLIFAGVFDCWESDKEKLLAQYYALRKDKKIPPEHLNLTHDYEMEMKYDVMDFLTLDYIDAYNDILSPCVYPEQVREMEGNVSVKIVGKITNLKKRKIKNGQNKGQEFYVMDLANNDDTYDVIVWPEQVSLFKHNLEEKKVVVIDGTTKTDWNDKSQVTAKSLHTIKEIRKFGGLSI